MSGCGRRGFAAGPPPGSHHSCHGSAGLWAPHNPAAVSLVSLLQKVWPDPGLSPLLPSTHWLGASVPAPHPQDRGRLGATERGPGTCTGRLLSLVPRATRDRAGYPGPSATACASRSWVGSGGIRGQGLRSHRHVGGWPSLLPGHGRRITNRQVQAGASASWIQSSKAFRSPSSRGDSRV